jgi:hypothetical protein
MCVGTFRTSREKDGPRGQLGDGADGKAEDTGRMANPMVEQHQTTTWIRDPMLSGRNGGLSGMVVDEAGPGPKLMEMIVWDRPAEAGRGREWEREILILGGEARQQHESNKAGQDDQIELPIVGCHCVRYSGDVIPGRP